MKKHKDLLQILRSNGLRITPVRRLLLQMILDNQGRQITLKEIQSHMERTMKGLDRSSLYRNLVTLKKLDIIQELNLPKLGKCFQYVLDAKIHHFYICKACGRAKPGNQKLFQLIESALSHVHGFSKANLSVVFYGRCSKCGSAGGSGA